MICPGGGVELFRMQYGCLPGEGDDRTTDLPVAFKAAAKKVQAGEVDPFNASEMLKYAGLWIGKCRETIINEVMEEVLNSQLEFHVDGSFRKLFEKKMEDMKNGLA